MGTDLDFVEPLKNIREIGLSIKNVECSPAGTIFELLDGWMLLGAMRCCWGE